MAGGATTPRNSTGDATPRRSFTKSMSSLFRSKKKKDSMKADADSIRAESQREDPAPDAPVSAPVERPSTAPSTTAEPRYSNNYAAEAAPAAPTPAVVEPTPEPMPAVPKAEEPVAAPVAAPAPDEAVAAPDTEPSADEPVAAPEPVPQPAPLADVPAGPTAEEQAGATDSPLAPGWEEVEADDGRIYYWNEETDSTTWDKPSASRTPMDTSRTSAAVRCPASRPQPADPSLPTPASRPQPAEPSLPSSREPPRRTAVGMRWPHGPGAACRAAAPVRQTERPKRALPQCAVCSPPPAQAAAYLQATAAPEVEPQPDTSSGPSLAERQRAFESGSAYQQTAAPSTGAKRGAANQEKVKALQKAGIQDDPRKPMTSMNTQHKLAIASLERKKERIESAGTGKGTTQMSDALKGLAAAQERPSGPSQHQQALERLNRASEQKSGEADAYSGRPKPQIVNSTLGAEFGGNQMQQVGGALAPPPSSPPLPPAPDAPTASPHGRTPRPRPTQAKAALFQKNQEEERRGVGSMKEEAMRKLNGKGVVSTKEAFQTRSKTGTQHNAAMAAFSQMEGARSTARGGPPWRAATHAATFCSRGPPACSGLPSRAERERAEPSPPGRRGGRGGVPVPARRVRLCRPWPMQAPT